MSYGLRGLGGTIHGLGMFSPHGLGFNYQDLLQASGMEDCDPRDSSCVARNQQRDIAVEDLWVSQYMSHADTADLPTPQIRVNVDNSPAAQAAFLNNQPLTSETISVNGGAPVSDSSLESRYYTPPPAPKPAAPTPPTPKQVAVAVQQQAAAGASALDTAQVVSPSPAVGGFSFDSIPWWGWAGAAGFAFLALGKGGR